MSSKRWPSDMLGHFDACLARLREEVSKLDGGPISRSAMNSIRAYAWIVLRMMDRYGEPPHVTRATVEALLPPGTDIR